MTIIGRYRVFDSKGDEYGVFEAINEAAAISLALTDCGSPHEQTDSDGQPLARRAEWTARELDEDE